MEVKRFFPSVLAIGVALVLAGSVGPGLAQGPDLQGPLNLGGPAGTAFTYQGRLRDGDGPADGSYDFEFKLYDDAGSQVGSTLTVGDKIITDGLFTVALDFGSDAFNGEARSLDIGVRPGDSTGAYTALTPRQALTPAPYAIHAGGAPWGGLTDVPGGFADGADDDTQLSELEVESFVTDGPLTLAEGTTLGGRSISTLVTDGCEGIQTAIDALPVTGGQIIVQAGTYTCTAPIVIDRDSVDLRGQGPATLLRLADGANSPVLVLGQTMTPPSVTHRDIRVSDLAIDGNRQNQTVECWGGPCDQGGLTAIRNNGITLRRVSDVLIARVTVYRARSGGLVVEKGSRRVTVSDFTSFDNQFDGLAAYEVEDSAFSDLYLYDNVAAGFSFDTRFNNNLVSDVVITGSGSVGIFMRDSRDNIFHGLQIRDSGEHGIFLAQVDGDVDKPAAGNTFSNVVVSASGGAGLRVNDCSCADNLVAASQFIGNSAGCISEPAACPGLVQEFGTVCR